MNDEDKKRAYDAQERSEDTYGDDSHDKLVSGDLADAVLEIAPTAERLAKFESELEAFIVEYGSKIKGKIEVVVKLLNEITALRDELGGIESADIEQIKARIKDIELRLKNIENKFNETLVEYANAIVEEERKEKSTTEDVKESGDIDKESRLQKIQALKNSHVDGLRKHIKDIEKKLAKGDIDGADRAIVFAEEFVKRKLKLQEDQELSRIAEEERVKEEAEVPPEPNIPATPLENTVDKKIGGIKGLDKLKGMVLSKNNPSKPEIPVPVAKTEKPQGKLPKQTDVTPTTSPEATDLTGVVPEVIEPEDTLRESGKKYSLVDKDDYLSGIIREADGPDEARDKVVDEIEKDKQLKDRLGEQKFNDLLTKIEGVEIAGNDPEDRKRNFYEAITQIIHDTYFDESKKEDGKEEKERSFPTESSMIEGYLDSVIDVTKNSRQAADRIIDDLVNNSSDEFIVRYGSKKLSSIKRKLEEMGRVKSEKFKTEATAILNQIYQETEDLVDETSVTSEAEPATMPSQVDLTGVVPEAIDVETNEADTTEKVFLGDKNDYLSNIIREASLPSEAKNQVITEIQNDQQLLEQWGEKRLNNLLNKIQNIKIRGNNPVESKNNFYEDVTKVIQDAYLDSSKEGKEKKSAEVPVVGSEVNKQEREQAVGVPEMPQFLSKEKFTERDEKLLQQLIESLDDYQKYLATLINSEDKEHIKEMEDHVAFLKNKIDELKKRKKRINKEEGFENPPSELSAEIVEETALPEIVGNDDQLNQLKEKLAEKRKIYIQTKQLFEKKDSFTGKLGRIFGRKKKADIENEFYVAEVEYREARAEYVGASIEKALDEQIAVVEAEVADELKTTKLEKSWAKFQAFYKKLGDWNLGEFISKNDKVRKEIERMSWFGKTLSKMISVRTGVYAGAAAIGTVTGGISVILAGGMRFAGTSGLSYDFLENLSKARKESKGALQELNEDEVRALDDEEISQKLRTIEGVVILDGVKLTESKYFSLYQKLLQEHKNRLEGSDKEKEIALDLPIAEFVDSSMKTVDDELEKELNKLRFAKKKHKVMAVAAGAAVASGLVGKLIRKGGAEAMDVLKKWFGVLPEEVSAERLVVPKVEDVHQPAVEMTPDKFREMYSDSLVHKGEGITHVLQRDLHANPEHLSSYAHIKGVEKIISEHNGNYAEITSKELNRAAWLIENDKTKGFGGEVLVKGPDNNVAVVFDTESGRYVMGTMDDSDVTSRIYSKLDINVEKIPTVIHEVGAVGGVPETLQGSEIKNFYPTENGFNVIMPDGRVLEGYRWEPLNPRGGEIGNVEALMSGDAQLSAGDNAHVLSASETGGATTIEPELSALKFKPEDAERLSGLADETNYTTSKSISVPFGGDLPAGSVYKSTEELMRAVEHNPQVTHGDAELTQPAEKILADVVSGADIPAETTNTTAEIETPKETVEKAESVIDPVVVERYTELYDQEFHKYTNHLRVRVEYHSLDGRDVKDSASFGAVVVNDLKNGAKIDSTNKELIDMLKPNSGASASEISEAVRINILNHVTENLKEEAELLFQESTGDGVDFVAGGSNAMKITSGGQDYFIFDKEYIFSTDGDNIIATDTDGVEHLVDVNMSEIPPRVRLEN